MEYKISNEALNDLENIWLYTLENWSLRQADRYITLIINEIEYLSVYPNAGKDYGHIRKGYFQSKIKSHLIFYRVNLREDSIEVIRILHQKMDIDNRLDD